MTLEPRLAFIGPPTLGQPGSLEALISAVRHAGFGALDPAQRDKVERSALSQEHDPRIVRLIALAYENEQLILETKHNQEGFEVLIRAHWRDDRSHHRTGTYLTAVSYQTALLTRREHNPGHHARLFLDLGKALYSSVSPAFGWLDLCEPAGHTTHEDVKNLSVPHLYWASYFGPEYVKTLGEKRLKSAPAWSVEELGDGGLLLVLSPYPGWAHDDQVSARALGAHLGFELT